MKMIDFVSSFPILSANYFFSSTVARDVRKCSFSAPTFTKEKFILFLLESLFSIRKLS